MNITIWDMDFYYHSSVEFNTYVMKVSSYHKQRGDKINFVLQSCDINRPYDYCYLFRNNKDLPLPPVKMLVDKKHTRWLGRGIVGHKAWELSDEILGCRPDYQLYPNDLSTKIRRAERVRFFNNKGQLLPWIQQWDNTYHNKILLVDDENFWNGTDEEIKLVLERLQTCKNIGFSYPVDSKRLINDLPLKRLFLSLKFARGYQISWKIINQEDVKQSIEFLKEFKAHQRHLSVGTLIYDYRRTDKSHWNSKQYAIEDFAAIRQWRLFALDRGVNINIIMPATRFETPYFELFEILALWMSTTKNISWLEWITWKYGHIKYGEAQYTYWLYPHKWSEMFRELLLQTYQYPDFITRQTKNKKIASNRIPWNIWNETFKYKI